MISPSTVILNLRSLCKARAAEESDRRWDLQHLIRIGTGSFAEMLEGLIFFQPGQVVAGARKIQKGVDQGEPTDFNRIRELSKLVPLPPLTDPV